MSAPTKIEQILKDKTSGSSELLYNLSKLLIANLNNPKGFINILNKADAKLIHFSNIANFIKQVNRIKDKQKLGEYLKSHLNVNIYNNLYETVKPILLRYNNLATLSNSSTLYHIFTKLGNENPKLQINISESRPKFEGRILANKLLKKGIKVNFFVDALIPEMVRNSAAVVIGADSILKDGSVINKVGSLSLALAAKHYNKSFYAVSLKTKRENKSNFNPPFENPFEVWKKQHTNLEVNNIYFERVPSELITKIISD